MKFLRTVFLGGLPPVLGVCSLFVYSQIIPPVTPDGGASKPSVSSITPRPSPGIHSVSQAAISKQLIAVIKSKQKQYVRESYGKWEGQCFTDDDLQRFHDKATTDRIDHDLRKDKQFLNLINLFKQLSESDKIQILHDAEETFKPTWAQIGKIDKTGQTEAGQIAEKEIARGVADIVRELQ